jgi:hypothetical protein
MHQSRADWQITSAIAKEMGAEFGYANSATAVFRSIANSVPAYEGIRYPDLKDESNPVQVHHQVAAGPVDGIFDSLRASVDRLPVGGVKNTVVPKVGHKLHRLTTMTSKTAQFHLLAHGNPKPENLLLSPLAQFNLDGTPRNDELAMAVGLEDRANPGGR